MKICISSGKGGVGKTTVAVNLAHVIAQNGKRILLIDGDLGLANVDVMLRVSAKHTIQDILDRGADPRDAVIQLESNLGVLPASSGTPEMVTLGPEEQEILGGYLDELVKAYDLVLVDASAGIGPSVLWFNTFADESLLITTPDPTSLTDAYALIKVLNNHYGLDGFTVVVNLAKDEAQGLKAYETLSSAAKKFLHLDLNLLGLVPYDEEVIRSVREQTPFVKRAPKSMAAKSLHELAHKILALI